MQISIKALWLTAALAAFVTAPSARADFAEDSELVIGVIGDNVSKKTKRYAPLVQYLKAQLSDAGVKNVRTHIWPTSDEIADALKNGEAHLFIDSPLVAAKIAKQSDAKPVLRRWKKGIAEYRSVILVPTSSAVQTVADLKGKRIAFQERDSTSGFMLPADSILASGLSMVEKQRPQDPYDSDKVNYYFTGSDRHTATWLAKGWVEAAGTDGETFSKMEAARPGEFKVIAKSIVVPRNAVLLSKHISDDVTKAITAALIGMDQNDEGRKILKGFKKTKKFDDFPDGAKATFDPIYAMIDRLDQHQLF